MKYYTPSQAIYDKQHIEKIIDSLLAYKGQLQQMRGPATPTTTKAEIDNGLKIMQIELNVIESINQLLTVSNALAQYIDTEQQQITKDITSAERQLTLFIQHAQEAEQQQTERKYRSEKRRKWINGKYIDE